MDVHKICRCCLTYNGPLLTIYEGRGVTSDDSFAAMFNKITGLKADPDDKLPDKICLLCIKDIKDFYAFQKKCEMSHRTLQLLFLSNVVVQQCSPIVNLQSMDTTEKGNITIVQMIPVESVQYIQTNLDDDYRNLPSMDATAMENIQIVNMLQMNPVESVQCIQTNVDDDNSQRVNIETNVELEIPTNYVSKCMAPSPDQCISKSCSPIPLSSIGSKGNGVVIQTPTISTIEIINSDSEIDSSDSIEFVSENSEVNGELVEMYNTSNMPEVNNLKKPFKCKYCDLTFTHSRGCLKHEKEHNGETLFKCQFCDKIFKRCSACKYHEKKSHNAGQKNFKCQYCYMQFVRLNDKNSHEHTTHKIEMTCPQRIKPSSPYFKKIHISSHDREFSLSI